MKDKIILATTSWIRIREFKKSGISFEQIGSNVDESILERKDPDKLVSQLAKMKCEAVAKNYSDGIVIGFDSIGYFNDQILEKPKSKQEAFERIKKMSGKSAQFITGIHMINTKNKKEISNIIRTEFLLKKLSDKQIINYLDKDPKFNTYAIAFGPTTKLGKTFLKEIKGNINNLIGLPMKQIKKMIKEIESN